MKNTGNQDHMETMILSGVKRSRIYDYFLGQGENIDKKDVDNIGGGD